ncbi:septum formation family protein [Arthrobacter sp. D1-29]
MNAQDDPARPSEEGPGKPSGSPAGSGQRRLPPKPSTPPTASQPQVPPAPAGAPAAAGAPPAKVPHAPAAPPAHKTPQTPPTPGSTPKAPKAGPGTAGAVRGPTAAPPAPAPEAPFPKKPPALKPGRFKEFLLKPRRNRHILLRAAFAVVLLAVVGVLVWLAMWLTSNAQQPSAENDVPGVVEISPTPLPSPLPLPREGVPPAEYRLGDCFKDFDPEALSSTLVACDTGHSAQLVAIYRYPAGDPYPGSEALQAKALEACQAARLAPAADDYTLNFRRAYPSSSSWESGDRRVDCYVMADGGNVINASVLP